MEQATLSATKRVLVVDDDSSIVQLLEKLLRLHRYEPLCATHWTDAMDHMEHRAPDLILMDLAMPTIDGISLMDFLHERGCAVPVIVISAYLTEEIKAGLLRFGVHIALEKPFQVAELIRHIEDLIGPVEEPEAPEIPESRPAPEAPPAPFRVRPPEHPANAGRTSSNRVRRYRSRRKKRISRSERHKTLVFIGWTCLASLLIAGAILIARYTFSDFDGETLQQNMKGSLETQILHELRRTRDNASP